MSCCSMDEYNEYSVLYKYLDYKGALHMLQDSNIQFTQASVLNDPFDCCHILFDFSDSPEKLCYIFGNTQEDMAKETRIHFQKIQQQTGVCCLCEINNQLLMWSYYTNHLGACIGINIPITVATLTYLHHQHISIQSVKYIEEFKKIKYWNNFQEDPSRMNNLKYLLSTKSKDWNHEQEIRLIISSSAHAPEFPFRPHLPKQSFNSLYLGMRMSEENKFKLIDISKRKFPKMPIYQMKMADNAFRLIAELII